MGTERDEFFGSGFFDWQLSGQKHHERMYAETGYNEEKYWGGFDRGPVATTLPDWAIGPLEKYAYNPVFAPAAVGWDVGRFGGGVHNGGVLRRDERFYYFYRGEQPLPDEFWAGKPPATTDLQVIDYICDIGIATSTDGVTFERDTAHSPLFRTGGDAAYSFEDTCVAQRDDGQYFLFCNRWDWTRPEDPSVCGAFVATSSDLVNWTPLGLAFPHATQIHRNPCVLQNPDNVAVRVNGRYVMYLNNGLVAYSEDLVHWQSAQIDQLWPGGEGCFALADYRSDDPDAILLFTGGHHSGHFYAIGEVRLSKDDPERPLEWLPRPVLVAEEKYPWEDCRSPDDPERLVSPFRDTIFFTGLTRHDRKWWMYYGGSEVYTCLAHADAPDDSSSDAG